VHSDELEDPSLMAQSDPDPGLWARLEHALAIVERDVRAGGITGPLALTVQSWDPTGSAWVEFRGACQGNGLRPGAGHDPQASLVQVADAAQETIMEVTWTVWPVCDVHDLGLHAELDHGTAVWRCTGNGTHTVAPIGELGQRGVHQR